MKVIATTLLSIVSFLVSHVPAAAQSPAELKNINDAALPQLLKQKKNIRFVAVNGSSGTGIKWYEEPKRATNQIAAMPTITNTAIANFHLVKDINVQTDANPANSDFIFNTPYAVVNKVMYFSANDGMHGTELWRSDGTAAGTHLVKDVVPGSASSNPTEIITAGNNIYFVTQNNQLYNYQLWTSDGTENGTVMLTDFQRQGPGVNGSYELTYTGDAVFFLRNNPFGGNTQLWKTNGTAASTMLVKDLDYENYAPWEYKAAGGLFYFTIYSFVTGRELWRSDGTESGTFVVKDITPNDNDNFFNGPEQLTAFNSKLYFSADDGTGRKLWQTDGTAAGTMPAPGSSDVTIIDDGTFAFTNESFAVQDNHLFMLAATPATGSELYKYSLDMGFTLVKNITPGAAGGYTATITPAFGKLAFQYRDTLNHKIQLWGTDGTAKNTVLIKSYPESLTNFTQLTPGNNLLYFVARDSSKGYELWKTDGTSKGTMLVKDIYAGATSSNPVDLTYVNGCLYFNAASQKTGTELWYSMGNANTTAMLLEINKTATGSSGPNYFAGLLFGNNPGATLNNTLYFTATKPETGYELYKSDGKAAATLLAKDIIPGETGSQPSMFTTKNKAVYFVANTRDAAGVYFKSMYKVDSTGAIASIATVPYGYVYSYDVADNGWVYYALFSFTSNRYELWRTDGTPAGNILLADNLSSSNYTFPVKTIGNNAFFTAADEAGTELWVTNGKPGGIKKVKDINKGSNSSNPYSLYVYKKELYFGADDGTGIAFWKSDGTANGTVKVKIIQPYGLYNESSGYNNFFCIINDVLYLNASTNGSNSALWKTNGTSGGTVLLSTLNGGETGSNPSFLTDVNGTLFLGTKYGELWKSDGTQKGTVLVKTLPTTSYYLYTDRCVADGKFFFNTNQQLWVSDGTDAGTHLVEDTGLNDVSRINNMVAANNAVFFNGYTDKYGYELYAGDAANVHPATLLASQPLYQKSASFSATVLQNPVAGMLRMNVVAAKDQTIQIVVSNAIGNVIAQQKAIVYNGNNNVNVNAANWQPGVYVVKLYNAEGDAVSVQLMK